MTPPRRDGLTPARERLREPLVDSARQAARSPVTIGLLAVLGVVVGVAVGEVRELDDPVQSRLGERVELVELIDAEQQRVSALSDRVEELSNEIEAAEAEALADAGMASDVEQDLEGLAVAAGTVGVAGPGVRVELDDAVEADLDGVSVNDVIIHEEDLQAVINALWAGGAEAMSVNGQRVLATTAIRCVGNVLLLHGNTYSPPYHIEAVGDPQGMASAVAADPGAQAFAAHAERFELGFEVQPIDELVVSGSDHVGSLRTATPHEPAVSGDR